MFPIKYPERDRLIRDILDQSSVTQVKLHRISRNLFHHRRDLPLSETTLSGLHATLVDLVRLYDELTKLRVLSATDTECKQWWDEIPSLED